MRKSLRALIFTLGILVTTGMSSAVYAKECNTINTAKAAGENLQSICAKYGVDASKLLTVNYQGIKTFKTTLTKTTPCKSVPTKVTPTKAVPKKVVPTKATPIPTKATPTKTTPTKTTPTKTTPTKVTPTPNLSADDKLEKEVVALVNQERAKLGLAALKDNAQVAKVAGIKSEDMRDKNYFSHTSPTYGSPFDMMKQFGITYTAAGENIAMGQPTAASVMSGWMNSPGHKANILSKNFTEIGVGVARDSSGTIYWTQQFIGK